MIYPKQPWCDEPKENSDDIKMFFIILISLFFIIFASLIAAIFLSYSVASHSSQRSVCSCIHLKNHHNA